MTAQTSPQVRMANEIAAQFRHLPAGEAAAAVAGHIRTFWEPRMTAELVRLIDAGAADLDPLVLAAARLLVKQR